MKGWIAWKVSLEAALAAAAPEAEARLKAVVAAAPRAASRVEIGVFPDQDGMGQVDVLASLHGPDLFALNRAVEPHRLLFASTAAAPALPALETMLEAEQVNEMLSDLCAAWAEARWRALGEPRIPCRLFADEGRGNRLPRMLL